MNDLFEKGRRGARASEARRAEDRRVIAIRGAREHNLKGIDVEIPRDRLVVFTGLSGSGKSSLAFDTIYAEGQRRYVESLSAYARQFLEMMQKPDVDQIDGLSPAISIEQKTTSRNPRSTVGTVTEIYDYMRLLWARVGVPYSPAPACRSRARPSRRWSTACWRCPRARASTCWRRWCAAARASTARSSPSTSRRATSASRSTASSTRSPRSRRSTRSSPTTSTWWWTAWWCGRFRDAARGRFEQCLKLAEGLAVDRAGRQSALHRPRRRRSNAKRSRGSGSRRYPSPRRRPSPQAERLAPAAAQLAAAAAPTQRLIFSEKFACPVSGFTIPEIEPRLFSFNNPFGACPECGGLGVEQHIDADLVIPDKDATLRKGAIAPWAVVVALLRADAGRARQALQLHARHPLEGPAKKTQDAILYGSGDDEIRFTYDDGMRAYRPRRRSRASSPTCSGAARRPRATGRARSWRNTSPTCPARPATAPASSPRRCA